MRHSTRTLVLIFIATALTCVACGESDQPDALKPVPDRLSQIEPVEVEEEEELIEPAEDTTGKKAGGEEGRFATPGPVDGQMVDKIDVKNLGPHKALGANQLGQGPLKNIFGNAEGFDSKMGVAMSGEGNSLVIGRGAGGMGMRGTGRGGGGEGFGRIHGLGKVETGGGVGVNSKIGGKGKGRISSKMIVGEPTFGNADGSGAKTNATMNGEGSALVVGRDVGGKGVKSKAKVQGRVVVEDPTTQEEFTYYAANPFVDPADTPRSTFAADVDTGSYTIARRDLSRGSRPHPSSVRVEEFVNFFKYKYAQPTGEVPFGVDFEAAPSPFGGDSVFLKIGVQGKTLTAKERKPAHLVFLVDTSGSMTTQNKLPLAKQALSLLVENLSEDDTVALATYAGDTRVVLQPTGMRQRQKIHNAIQQLGSGGSTAMASGLENAYKLAYKTLKPGHVNRVIVLSDGDANVGGSSHTEILSRIEHFTKEGVTLSTIGFGMGNYKDTTMEQLANKGNGNYYYIDSFKQARRIFQEQLGGTLQVIAKDVKIQVDFDPKAVASYRLVGYENRHIANRDFRNDAVDAGEIGSGHSVTAIYELKLTKDATANPAVVRIRHKAPQGARATETAYDFTRDHLKTNFRESSKNFRLALTAMAFADKLRRNQHSKEWSWGTLINLAANAGKGSADGRELLTLIQRAARFGA